MEMDEFLDPYDEQENFGDDGSVEKNEQFEKISALSKEGYRLAKSEKLDAAIQVFSQVLLLDDANSYALVGLGNCERKNGRYNEAISYYSRCLASSPDNCYALFGLADCYRALMQYQKAIEIWERYLSSDPDNINVLTRIGDACRKLHKFEAAQAAYGRVLAIDDANPYALTGLSLLYYDFKYYDESLSTWMKIYKANDGNVDIRVLTSIGNCYRKLRDFAGGLAYFEAALKMDADNFYALFGLADCYRGLGQQMRSVQYWNRILDQNPNNKIILTRTGDAYRNAGNYDTASQYYKRALNIEFDIYAVFGLALIEKALGNFEKALNSLLPLIDVDPSNSRIYIEVADCYEKLHRIPDAIAILKQFQRRGIKNRFVSDKLDALTAAAVRN